MHILLNSRVLTKLFDNQKWNDASRQALVGLCCSAVDGHNDSSEIDHCEWIFTNFAQHLFQRLEKNPLTSSSSRTSFGFFVVVVGFVVRFFCSIQIHYTSRCHDSLPARPLFTMRRRLSALALFTCINLQQWGPALAFAPAFRQPNVRNQYVGKLEESCLQPRQQATVFRAKRDTDDANSFELLSKKTVPELKVLRYCPWAEFIASLSDFACQLTNESTAI